MSLPLLAGLSILCAARLASAERSIVAEVSAAVPFDAGQLTAEMRVRLPADGPPVRVRVSATPNGVRIEAGSAVREVSLRELTGTDAARLIALAANDLLPYDLATPPLDPPSLTTAEPRRESTTIGLLGAAAAWEHVLGGLAIDVAIPRGTWLVAIDAGGGTLVGGPLSLTAAVIRVGAGVRTGWLELRAGATLAPVIVGTGDGDRTVLAGAGVSVRIRFPISSGVRAIVAIGVDMFATRTTYLLDGATAMSTPRGAPWLAAGMELTP